MTLVWELDLPDSEKLALLALADCANDEGLCWPSMATLAKKCSKSDRTVQKAIQSLIEKGHLSRDERPGRGVLYQIHPRSDDTPEKTSPPKPCRSTPEAASDKPSRTINSPLAPQSESAEEQADPTDQYWRGAKGRTWQETGAMLKRIDRTKESRPRLRKRLTSSAPNEGKTLEECEAAAARYRQFGDETLAHYWDKRASDLRSDGQRQTNG